MYILATAHPVQDHPYSQAETLRGEADTTTLPLCFIALVPMSQYGGQLQQEIASSENTFHVLEPHVPDYSCNNPSTVVAMVLYSQLYHAVSVRNMPCSFLMFVSYPFRPLTVSLWTLFITSTQLLTCPLRPQMEIKTRTCRLQR